MPFEQIRFDNRFINNTPVDPETDNYPRQVMQAYSFVTPAKVSKPQMIAYSESVAQIMGFTKNDVTSQDFAEVFTGNQLIEGMKPYATCYGGYQFGHWAGQLGDGRAINLGEVTTNNAGHQTLQLKGAGPTPYSRTADGLAVLRSSVREFLCSESMYHLGVPTTRALSLSLTGEYVMRDMFYNGDSRAELGAVVCRVSPSFTRFGSFQLPSARKDLSLLKTLVDHCIISDFPSICADIDTDNASLTKQHYIAWFNEICSRTLTMVIHWQRVGFVHGVMNTDNMSIIGETIDYGPYGWIDNFDLHWTPNTTDSQHQRYCFGKQGEISHWNLYQLANAVLPLINDTKPLEEILNDYPEQYQQQWQQMMNDKLALSSLHGDLTLITDLEKLLSYVETDMTVFYRRLADFPLEQHYDSSLLWQTHFSDCYYDITQINEQSDNQDAEDYRLQFSTWLTRYAQAIKQENINQNDRRIKMNKVNPKYVLRNYLAQQAIELAEKGDYSEISKLQILLQKPYDEQPESENYAEKRPEWARTKAGCSMLSCSS
jgi:uncharacterized protein YdiU (UPF0061 family)